MCTFWVHLFSLLNIYLFLLGFLNFFVHIFLNSEIFCSHFVFIPSVLFIHFTPVFCLLKICYFTFQNPMYRLINQVHLWIFPSLLVNSTLNLSSIHPQISINLDRLKAIHSVQKICYFLLLVPNPKTQLWISPLIRFQRLLCLQIWFTLWNTMT